MWGYLLNALGVLATMLVGKYVSPEAGAAVGAAVVGVGSRVLHKAEPPAPKAP